MKVLTVHEVSVLSSLRWSQFVGGQPQLTDQLILPSPLAGTGPNRTKHNKGVKNGDNVGSM